MAKLSERGERLVLQALKASNIEEPNRHNQYPDLLGGHTVFWHRTSDDIEIVVNSSQWFTGRLRGSITLGIYVDRTLRLFPEDADAVSTLIEVINYLRGNLVALPLETSRGIYLRSHNLLSKKLSAKQKFAIEAVEGMITPMMTEAVDRFTEMNKKPSS